LANPESMESTQHQTDETVAAVYSIIEHSYVDNNMETNEIRHKRNREEMESLTIEASCDVTKPGYVETVEKIITLRSVLNLKNVSIVTRHIAVTPDSVLNTSDKNQLKNA
ncbi:hypothetical protein J6590_096339, partial [Homalodisca vitripennis]